MSVPFQYDYFALNKIKRVFSTSPNVGAAIYAFGFSIASLIDRGQNLLTWQWSDYEYRSIEFARCVTTKYFHQPRPWSVGHGMQRSFCPIMIIKVHGLCGTMDGNMKNDFHTHNGVPESNPRRFGDFFSDIHCSGGIPQPVHDTCSIMTTVSSQG